MKCDLAKQNSVIARRKWPSEMNHALIDMLKILTQRYRFSISSGDLLFLDNGWYVTHTGLIRLAARRRCCGIQIRPVTEFSDAINGRYAFKAIVYKSRNCQGFAGYGDANPGNISSLVRGAEMRVAETRAVNRALRKAYGIGICSVEEIGSSAEPAQASPVSKKLPPQPVNGNGGGRTVRDRLCQIIRQHQLDPNLVKSYATEFCSVKTLKEATREQVESFVAHLSDWAAKDRNALLCQLNSYPSQKEGAA